MNIRLEQPQDWLEVENLTREAFWNVYRPGCQEHFVLNQYRDNPAFIPELDFVMEEDGRISIHPDFKRKGYGLKLLRYALAKAREMGVGLLQMEGNIEFYKHAGFDLASKLRIHYHGEPAGNEVPYFLALELIPGYWGNREGTYCPPAGYFVADAQPEAFAAYDAGFRPKEKHLVSGQLPQFCHGCGMPLSKDEDCGHNADGSINFDYCQNCCQDGKFLQECSMEESR